MKFIFVLESWVLQASSILRVMVLNLHHACLSWCANQPSATHAHVQPGELNLRHRNKGTQTPAAAYQLSAGSLLSDHLSELVMSLQYISVACDDILQRAEKFCASEIRTAKLFKEAR